MRSTKKRKSKGCIYKSKLELVELKAKFCGLITSLSAILLQLKLSKLKLEVLKVQFSAQKKKNKRR